MAEFSLLELSRHFLRVISPAADPPTDRRPTDQSMADGRELRELED